MIFAVTGEQFNLGSHFLIWSIHNLASETTYYRHQDQTTRTIPASPLINDTAHRMFTNHCRSMQCCHENVKLLSHRDGLNHIKFTPKKNTLLESYQEIVECQKFMTSKNIKVINIACDGLQNLISFLRFDYEVAQWQFKKDRVKEHCKHYWPNFFSRPEIFQDNLESWHDIREGIAFNIRPNDFNESFAGRTFGENIMHYHFKDIILDGRNTIEKILNFLRIKYSHKAIDEWCTIHDTWSSNIRHFVDFCNDIDNIIENIVSYTSMNLGKYKMDVLKEGVLLHFLMFKHDLNLNTKIDILPANTKAIAELLGKNKRKGIENLYGK